MSDSGVIQRWFNLVEWVCHEYGICDDDVYNMDEKGFLMGLAHAVKVIVHRARKEEEKSVGQTGNRELVTVIEGIGSSGHALPPVIIFKGKQLFLEWYKHLGSLPPGMYEATD